MATAGTLLREGLPPTPRLEYRTEMLKLQQNPIQSNAALRRDP